MARSGLGAAAAAGENWATAAPCTIVRAALLSPRCMQVAVSMEKLPGTCFAGGGANGFELRRSLWLEVGSMRQRRRAKTGPTAAPCTTITADLLSPRCMQVAVSMKKLPGTCFAGGGANVLELRRSLWLEAGSVRQRRRAKTGPTAAPCTIITAALPSPRCMQVAVSMGKLPGTCFAGGGAMGLGYGARCG